MRLRRMVLKGQMGGVGVSNNRIRAGILMIGFVFGGLAASGATSMAQGVDCKKTYARECRKSFGRAVGEAKSCLQISNPLLQRLVNRDERAIALLDSGFEANKAELCRIFREKVGDIRRNLPLIRKNCVFGAHKGQAQMFLNIISIENKSKAATCGRA